LQGAKRSATIKFTLLRTLRFSQSSRGSECASWQQLIRSYRLSAFAKAPGGRKIRHGRNQSALIDFSCFCQSSRGSDCASGWACCNLSQSSKTTSLRSRSLYSMKCDRQHTLHTACVVGFDERIGIYFLKAARQVAPIFPVLLSLASLLRLSRTRHTCLGYSFYRIKPNSLHMSVSAEFITGTVFAAVMVLIGLGAIWIVRWQTYFLLHHQGRSPGVGVLKTAALLLPIRVRTLISTRPRS
jgi:hypothetical protein